MIPKKEDRTSLYKTALKKLLNDRHPLYRMAEAIDWGSFDEAFTPLFCPDNGRPGIPTRMMVALHFLKYSENLSDEDVVEKWVQNPYWQYFCGGEAPERDDPNRIPGEGFQEEGLGTRKRRYGCAGEKYHVSDRCEVVLSGDTDTEPLREEARS